MQDMKFRFSCFTKLIEYTVICVNFSELRAHSSFSISALFHRVWKTNLYIAPNIGLSLLIINL